MNLLYKPDATADLLIPVLGVLLGQPLPNWQDALDNAIRNSSWKLFTKLLWENRITLRAATALRGTIASVSDQSWETLIEAEQTRQSQMLDYLTLLNERMDLEFVVIKTVDNFPDFGHDVDLLTRKDGESVKAAFAAQGFRYHRQKLAERIADKMGFTIEDYCPAEAHCARIGEFGEHRELTRYILENKKKVTLGDVTVWGPDYPSRLFLIVLQRLYRHFNVRSCDVINVVNWIRSGSLKVPEAYELASRFGILPGVRWYFRFLNEILAVYGSAPIVPDEPAPDVLHCDRLLIRFNRWKFVPEMFARKFAWSVARAQWESAAREFLFLPVGAMALISHRVLKRDAVW